MLSAIKQRLVFLRQFLRNPERIGSLLPSSKRLARQITRFIPEYSSKDHRCRILEIGAGTGTITKEILKKMKAGDHLDVVEIDRSFCKILKKKFKGRKNIEIICGSIVDWQPEYKYDVIISSLPMNSFSPETVRKLIVTLQSLINTDGTLSYFEYRMLPHLKLFTSFGKKKDKFRQVLELKEKFYQQYGIASETILQNLPPARVLHFKPKPSHA